MLQLLGMVQKEREKRGGKPLWKQELCFQINRLICDTMPPCVQSGHDTRAQAKQV